MVRNLWVLVRPSSRSRAFRHEDGFGLTQSIIGMGLVTALGLGVAGMMTNMSYSQNALRFRSEADTLNEELRALLSSPRACQNSIAGLSAAPGAVHQIIDLKDGSPSPGIVKFRTGDVYGSESLRLQSLELSRFEPGALPTKGQMTLTVSLLSAKKATGTQLVVRHIHLNLDLDGASLITSCVAQAKMSDGIWQRSTQNSLTHIFYQPPVVGGNVGIGTSLPTAPFHVSPPESSMDSSYYLNADGTSQGVTAAFVGERTETGGLRRNRVVIASSSPQGSPSLDLRLNNSPNGAGGAAHLYTAPADFFSASPVGPHPALFGVYVADGVSERFPFSIRLDNGNVGLKTMVPATDLHVTSPDSVPIVAIGAVNNDLPDLQSVLELVTVNGGSRRLDDPQTRGWQLAAAGRNFSDPLIRNDFRISYWDGSSMTPSAFRQDFLIDSGTGNIGVGTSNPLGAVHISRDNTWSNYVSSTHSAVPVMNSSFVGLRGRGTATTPFYPLQNDALSTFTGRDVLDGFAPTRFGGASITMIAAQNFSSTSKGTDIVFSSTPLNSDTQADRMRITASGNVGIGTNNPAFLLTVNGEINGNCVRANGGPLGGTCVSDERLKDGIRDFDLGLDALLGLEPKSFKFNGLGGTAVGAEREIGLIAQEVERAAPSLVSPRPVKLRAGDAEETEIKQVNYTALIYVIINSVKELYRLWHDDQASVRRELVQAKVELERLRDQIRRLEENQTRLYQKLMEFNAARDSARPE